jgi:mannose-1-phosphate guanylyltransferase
MDERTWTVVLAAGDGTRLAALTKDHRGNAVPKQFCSLNGGGSLLQEALRRARKLAPRDRVCAIVARQHERYWRAALWSLATHNVIVQPRNCGTANGVLFALFHILERDPLARIVFLPADHYVRDEASLAATMRKAATLLARDARRVLLIGIEPDDVDPELGYILPGACDARGWRHVERFVEKPGAAAARELIEGGAMWNSFIFAAHAPTLLGLFRERVPQIVEDMETAMAHDTSAGKVGAHAVERFYERLPSVDFSRQIVQGAESRLALLAARACGWSDLGTPRRVLDALRRIDRAPRPTRRTESALQVPAFVNLADQCARLAAAF